MDDEFTMGDVMREARVMAYLESCALRNGLVPPPVESPCVTQVVMPITCPTCGSCMEFVTNSAPARTRVTAVFLCPKCHVSWQFIGGLQAAFSQVAQQRQPPTRPEDVVCGTEQGYRKHLRAGERPVECVHCKAAHAKDRADRKQRARV